MIDLRRRLGVRWWITDETIVRAGPCSLLTVRLQDDSKVCKRAARGWGRLI
jgi:hypothetical protein